MQAEAAHHKYNYEELNKAFTKKNTSKEETFNLADSSDKNPHPAVSLKIPLPELGKRKPQSPMIRILLTVAKSAVVPLAVMTAIEQKVCREAFIIDK